MRAARISIIGSFLGALWVFGFLGANAQEVVAPPTNVVAAQSGFAESVQITWDASATEGAALYRVYRSTKSTSTGTSLGVVGGLAFVDTGVSYNATYYYRVVAVYLDVDSVVSEQVSATPTVPAPTSVRAEDTQEGRKIKVTWERPSPGLVLTYDVYRSTSVSSAGTRIASKVSGTEYMDTSAANGAVYYYRVRSVTQGNVRSADSDVASASSSTVTAEPPRLNGSSGAHGVATLSWTKPANADVGAYRVYRSMSEGERGDFRLETTSRSFTERELPPNTTYFYRVQAISALRVLLSESDPVRVVTRASSGAGVLLPVSNLAAKATGSSGQVKLAWKNPPPSNFSYLRIYRNTVASVGSLITDRVRGTSFTDRSLENGVTYYYAVRTVDGEGNEHPGTDVVSAIPFARVRGSVPPSPATELSAHDQGTGSSVKLAWKNPEPLAYASVSIYRSTVAGEIGERIFSGYRGSEFLNIRSVQTDQGYYYTVVVLDKNGVQSEQNPMVRGIATLKRSNDGFDTDGDGLPDAWERSHGFHPYLKDNPESDDDSDGLGVVAEYRNGTDPWNPDSDGDGYNDGTEVANNFDPLGLGRNITTAKEAPSAGNEFAYGKARLSSLAEERELAKELRRKLEVEFGSGRIPNPQSHWPKLVNAYIYGEYTAAEIAHTLRYGPGLVHPTIPAAAWRQSGEYLRKKA